MPAAYAHYIFGQDCIDSLPEMLQDACQTYREIFDFGVHGPDIFFYYDPLRKNSVNQFGSDLHHKTGREFFAHCCGVYRENPDKKAMMAYLLGFLAHFTLDSSCHAYINRMASMTDMSHNLIEAQYEAYLMRKDGLEPVKVDRAESLHPTKKTAGIIARFFPFEQDQVLRSLKGQEQVLNLLYSPREVKKKTLKKAIRTLHIGTSFDDLFIDGEELHSCKKTNAEIEGKQAEALARYPELAESLIRYLTKGNDLCDWFDYDFEGILHNQQRYYSPM